MLAAFRISVNITIVVHAREIAIMYDDQALKDAYWAGYNAAQNHENHSVRVSNPFTADGEDPLWVQ